MKKIIVEIIVEEVAGRTFRATCKAEGITGIGAGSSEQVAAAKSVGGLFSVMKHRAGADRSHEEVNSDVYTHIVTAGKKGGLKCFIIQTLGVLDDGSEIVLVKYSDGTTGRENTKFLAKLSAL